MFKHIVLATDGSASAEHASKVAIDLARVHGAKVTAAFVIDPYPYVGIGEANPMGFHAYIGAAQEASAHAFTALSEMAAKAGVQLETRAVENQRPAPGVIAVAQSVGADLIVIGSHGRHGIQKLVLGSVADKVVTQSHCPVLVVR